MSLPFPGAGSAPPPIRRIFRNAVLLSLFAAIGCSAADSRGGVRAPTQICKAGEDCRAKSPHIRAMRVLVQNGARPHWSPDSKQLLFDARGEDGYADVYLTGLDGEPTSLTEGKDGLPQKNNGNAIFHPSGDYVVFISEEEEHFMPRNKWFGDPGLGLFSNLWAMDPQGHDFWKLTDIPVRKKLFSKTPVMASVNPHFDKSGSRLVWTERYDGGEGWGKWRVKIASFGIRDGKPTLADERILFEPKKGNYVTALGFLDSDSLLVAGNLDGQDEYGMDLYRLDIDSSEAVNLLNTPDEWEEGACLSSTGDHIAYMTNKDSPYKLDRSNPNWASQKLERDYYLMRANGSGKERLTYFNDPEAPEHLGGRDMVAICEFSPNGRYLAGTLGIDTSDGKRRDLELKIVLIELKKPL